MSFISKNFYGWTFRSLCDVLVNFPLLGNNYNIFYFSLNLPPSSGLRMEEVPLIVSGITTWNTIPWDGCYSSIIVGQALCYWSCGLKFRSTTSFLNRCKHHLSLGYQSTKSLSLFTSLRFSPISVRLEAKIKLLALMKQNSKTNNQSVGNFQVPNNGTKNLLQSYHTYKCTWSCKHWSHI